jgi:hypothetical protein
MPWDDLREILCCFQAYQYQGRPVLLAYQAKEEKKATKEFQARLCQDQVEGMGPQALLGPLGPRGGRATQVSILRNIFMCV